MAGTLSRFFASESTSGAIASIRNNAQLLRSSQILYDQILPSAPTMSVHESNTRSKESEPDKIWALVAVVATGMTQEIKQELAEATHQCTDSAMPLNWHLVELLAEAGVGLQDFLLYLTSLFNRLCLEPELVAATTLLKEEFTIATLLFEKFRLLWATLVPKPKQSFVPLDPEPERDTAQLCEVRMCKRYQQLFRAGWLLFVLAKRRLVAHYTGLGHLYTLLLATLHLVLANARASQVPIELEVAAALSAMGALGADNAATGHGETTSGQILKALCAVPKVDSRDVARASDHLHLVLQQLRAEHVLHTDTDPQAGPSTALFADNVLQANVTRLYERYANDYLDGCGKLDERFYLETPLRRIIRGTPRTVPRESPARAMQLPECCPKVAQRHETDAFGSRDSRTPLWHRHHPTGMHSPLIHAWQWQGSPRSVPSIPPSPRVSPARGLQSPVSAAVEIHQLVRDVLSSTMLTPVTPELRQFFADCAANPTDRIARVLSERSALLLAAQRASWRQRYATATMELDTEHAATTKEQDSEPYVSNASGAEDSLERIKNLTIVLFYRVLEPLLRSERARLRTTDFSKLLNNEVFVAALFAVSAEVVLQAHALGTLAYPLLLEHVHVNVFHFVTTSDSFVKYAPKLPSALKKHLSAVKNHLLDSAVWQSGSALYQLLPQRKDPSAPTQSASTLIHRLNGGSPATHAPVLRLFFRMVFSRAASRIYQMGHILKLDATNQNQIWTVVKECITSHQYLLRNRHLDLIVLCSIYAICKVSRRPPVSPAAATMSFKELLACYKQLNWPTTTGTNSIVETPFKASRSGEGVTFGIPLEDASSRGDIIKFYNQCYIAPMKVFILQFQCHESQMAAADAAVASASRVSLALPSGLQTRREGAMGLTSDAESISRAASDTVQKLFEPQSTAVHGTRNVVPCTPPRPLRHRSSPFVSSPAVAALQMFTTAEVQTLPVAMNQTSPRRVKSSNLFMSPLQQVRLDRRSDLTPRTHALYAIGESPARDLALINRAVNTAPATLRRGRAPNLVLESDMGQDPSRMRKKQKSAS